MIVVADVVNLQPRLIIAGQVLTFELDVFVVVFGVFAYVSYSFIYLFVCFLFTLDCTRK